MRLSQKLFMWLVLSQVTITNDILRAADNRPLAAFGELRGHMEPCGCNPATDLGGVQRLVKALDTLKGQGTELVVSTGNNIGLDAPGSKDVVILKALNQISPDAILLNSLEQKHLGWLREQLKQLPQIEKSFVLSNRIPSVKVAPLAQTLIVKGDWLLFGFRQHGDGVEAWSDKVLERLKQAATEHAKATSKLLLFEGDDATLAKIAKTGWFTQIIVANRTPMTEEPSPREKDEPGRLLVQDKFYMVPSFGQGILAPHKPGASGSGIMQGSMMEGSCATAFNDGCGSGEPRKASQFKIPNLKLPGQTATGAGPFIWLDKSWQEGSRAESLIVAYNNEQRQIFQAKIDARLAKLKDTPFAGSEACATCHPDAFKKWQESRHAQAFSTLKKVGKESDSECVSCHVLGMQADGGFVSEQHTPQFVGVSCENCHGPRKAHVANPTIKGTTKAEAMCVTCHKEPHSYQFAFKNYWPKIEHHK